MSDKSFGDHTNKNIVKNPLLSTAVTGLSLDELTHKAVVLPVSPTLGLTARSEQTGPQNVTLGYTQPESTKSSGDAVVLSSKPVSEPNKYIHNSQRDYKTDDTQKIATVTQSKASVKSEDDFDVNEYIARLQGTRYVSAPLHSHLKDDQNANLDTTEENLEEINLNDSQNIEVQQSLTADLKQNFSQLPTVLPHVANAVFNSFSNMLNLRSRDQTPDVDTQYQRNDNNQGIGQGYQGTGQMYPGTGQIQGQFQGGTVPLVAEEKPVKELAPPPKEPPVSSGPSNFRLPTKKKYAQIPGLSTKDAHAVPYHPASYGIHPGVIEKEHISGSQAVQSMIASVFNPPSYGIAPTTGNLTGTHADQSGSSFFIPQDLVPEVVGTENRAGQSAPFFFTPPSYGVAPGVTPGHSGAQAGQSVPSLFTPPLYEINVGGTDTENNTQAIKPAAEAQTTKTIPSFYTPSAYGVDLSVKEKEINTKPDGIVNIFNPANVVDSTNDATKIENTREIVKENKTDVFTVNDYENTSVQQFVGIDTPQANTPIIPPPPMFSSLRRDSATGANVGKTVLPPSVARRISANQPIIKSQNVPMTPMDNIFVPELTKEFNPSQSTPFIAPLPVQSDSPALLLQNPAFSQGSSALPSLAPSSGPSFFSLSNQPPVQQIPLPSQQPEVITKSLDSSSTLGTQIFNSIPTQMTETSQPTGVPLFFTPSDKTTSSAIIPSAGFDPTTSSNMFTLPSQPSTLFNPAPQEPIEKPKPPIEPPKATGTNFRMTKKRPQYYSGPIEGVGSISNNIKPTIPMATPSTNYQASLFTPEVIKPEEIPVDNSIPTLEAYSVPKEATFIPPAPQTSATSFDISQPHQYTQEYNTAFDFSRATTDAFEDPKPEPTGFGIIGSLKSKLSSIDINKIQSSVTTFFDPAYNDTKKVEASAEQHVPYGQGQSNFDLYVHNVQHQSHYQYDNQSGYDYSQYYQPNYSQVKAQNTSEENYYTDPNHSHYVPEHSNTSNTSNIPENTVFNANQNVSMYFNPNLTAQDQPTVTKYEKEMNNASIIQTSLEQQESTEIDTAEGFKNENVPLLPKPDVITTLDKNNVKDDITRNVNTNAQETYSNSPAGNFFETSQADIAGPPTTTDDDSNFGQINSYNMPPSATFFDYPQISKEDLHARDVNPDIVEDTLKQVPTYQTQSSIAYPGTATSFFDMQNTKTDDLLKSRVTDIEFDDQAINVTKKLSNLAIAEDGKHNKHSIIGLKEPEIASNVQYVHTDFAKDLGTKESSILQSISKNDNIPFIGVSTAPLFGLSAMLADKSKEMDSNKSSPYDTPKDHNPTILGVNSNKSFFENLAETEIEQKNLTGLSITDVKNVLLIEPPQEHICAVLKRNASSNRLLNLNNEDDGNKNMGFLSKDKEAYNLKKIAFFDHLALEDPEKEHPIDPSELSICETCREVNSPVDKEVNLTSQMIENITSRIQLSNAVEAPLTEKRVSDGSVENTAIDDQRTEITNITEDTIETLQAQSATELLDDAPNVNFGWSTESTYSSTLHGHDFSFDSGSQERYGFKQDTTTENQNNIGFDMFYDNTSAFFHSMPENASDEIKAEFKTTKDDVIPARQMSVPTAPPAEEDNKSETGLDVHSIEQDANKDFPIEEEFVIEPSETDDDKIETREKIKTPVLGDTFTNRVERFHKATDYKETPDSNAPKSMASYFDTGNYAVESHYKNSLTTPSSLPITDLTNMPGFGDHRRLSGFSGEPYIPETSTQTRTTNTCTFLRSDSGNQGRMTFVDTTKNIPPLTQIYDSVNHGNISFADKIDNPPTFTEMVGSKTEHEAIDAKVTSQDDKKDNLTPLTEIFGTKTQEEPVEIAKNASNTLEIVKNEKVLSQNENVPLPDPLNFFSSTIDESKPETADYNRLASYFSAPVSKPDHSKSFFELSQSQNHYRHPLEEKHANSPPKPFFELSQSQNHYIDQNSKANIANLMRDLTSTQNITPQEQIVTTVNYFTVELDNKTEIGNLKTDAKEITEINTTKSLKNTHTNTNPTVISNGDNEKHDKTKLDSKLTKKRDIDIKFKTMIINCRHCNVNTNEFRMKQCTNDAEGGKNGDNPDMHTNVTKKPVPVDVDNFNMNENTEEGVAIIEETKSSEYTPVRHHWFYRVDIEEKSVWRGFSVNDSRALEEAFNSPNLTEDTLVATDGGRFDVNVVGRLRIAVYWKEKPTNVRRCSWFYKGTTDARYVPYTETVADKLEEEYRHGITTGEWHRRLTLPNNEIVIMHGASVMVHFLQGATDAFSTPAIILLGKRVYRNPPKIKVAKDQPLNIDHLVFFVHGAGEYKRDSYDYDATSRPRVVRRGHEESEIEEASPTGIDHLLLLCHGVGSACDMRFRSVEEVVEDFRATSLQLVQSHYKNSYDNGVVNRVEVLPISWHAQLHSGEAGVDSRLSRITLDSIPRLRAFTNHTVLDVLFYTSPVYHQTIIDTVCFELNRIYNLFKSRNPGFTGGVSLGGHSLGSVILYDLLCHQKPKAPLSSKSSSEKTYLAGITSNLPVNYPVLQFQPDALYALGSPIAIFECIRGVECLGLDFCLPTCKNFFNIFHPYDPIAYRIEPLINPQLQNTKPFLIPHHKGRKRMHLELKDTMVRVGADLKQKLLESLRTTWNKWKATPPTDGQLEKVVEEEMEKEQLCEETTEESQENNIDTTSPELLGRLNAGRRVDYVLQEAPLEMINEYLFAMSSHVGYWESEDTMLLMLREIYSSLGVQPDSTVPQQSMTVQRTRKLDEATVVNEKECPSTSRAGLN